MAQIPPQQPGSQAPQPRMHRTHISDAVVAMLRSLPLPDKLKKNKEIEEKNQARRLLSINHALDPVAFPLAGSEAASMISLDSIDREELSKPHVFDRLKSFLTHNFFSEFSDIISKKRAGDSLLLDGKRLKISCGERQAPNRSFGVPTKIDFQQLSILEITDSHTPLPLHFFTNKNLRYLTSNLSTIPRMKVFSVDETAKAPRILDVQKLCTLEFFGNELSISCAEWTEASENYLIFQAERDSEGPDGNFTVWLTEHLSFFRNIEDRIEYFRAWQPEEIRLWAKYRLTPEPFDAGIYYLLYMQARTKLDLQKSLNVPASRNFPNSRRPSSSSQFPATSSSSRPFRSGNKPSLPPCCLI